MKVHFISIGGSVMHQLAIALKKKGYQVSGTDDEIVEPSRTALLINDLLPKKMGWQTDFITADLDAVILGMHAKNDNPEIQKAIDIGLKIYSFPEYIFQESLHKKRVVVGGSHGKTTTTSMIMHVLKNAEISFDYLVGARLKGFEQSVSITDAPIIVCEGDEYPASAIERKPKFHFLYRHIAVITGIAWDHINVFPTIENYLEQFEIFIDKIETGGVLIYNQTDETLARLVANKPRTDISYQPYSVPAYHIDKSEVNITLDGINGLVNVFGQHNLLNMQAAYLACKALGVSASTFLHSIVNFAGAANRLELIGHNKVTNVYRDFAHAPSKVKATVQAVKEFFSDRLLIAVLELHTFSSLNAHFMKQYNNAMEMADVAAVFYSAHALELKRMPPLDEEQVKAGFNKEGLRVFTDKSELFSWLSLQQYENANLLLMSSGNFDGAGVTDFAATITKPQYDDL